MDGSPDAIAGVSPDKRRLGDLGVRAVSGLVLVAVAILTARHEPGDLFVLVWLAASVAVFWEWERLVGGTNLTARLGIGVFALILIAWWVHPKLSAFAGETRVDVAPLGLCISLAAIAQAVLADSGRKVWATAGMLYAGLLMLAVSALRFSFPDGVRSIIWLFAVVWSTDVFAYFGGRLIGGAKLWPRVSPSKTWSGTLSGLVAGACIGTFTAVRDLQEPTSITWVFVLSLSTATLSQMGDALESAVKRHFGVKDSGALIPGHGGVMDRLDGFIAAAVFAFVIGSCRHMPSVANGLFYWP